MSFLPYFVLLFLLLLIRWVVQLWKLLYRKPNKPKRKHKLAPFFVLSFGLLFFLSSARVQNFYHQELLTSPASTHGIKVLFSNLYKGNLNFEAIKNQILTENPDVVLFVEFSEAHKAGLQAFFDEHYPYMNTTTWSKIFVGSVVFSKYPIENLADDFEQGRRRYGYFKLEKNQIPYYFYLVHTASPVSPSFFLKRNAQLQQLQSEFLELHQPQRGVDAKVIMVWDFNISPWSKYYQDFAKGFTAQLENATRSFPMLFTWHLWTMLQIHEEMTFVPEALKPLAHLLPLRSHIDHLFLSPAVNLHALKRIQIPGSDHSGFLFSVE